MRTLQAKDFIDWLNKVKIIFRVHEGSKIDKGKANYHKIKYENFCLMGAIEKVLRKKSKI